MNLDKVAICNMALANIGSPPIHSLDDKNVSARACNLRYDEARLETLSASLWNFASMWKDGVRVDIPAKKPWAYVHSYPSDALRVFEIQRATTADKDIPFEVTDRPDLPGKLIHSNVEQPTFVYTRDKSDVSTFDWDFIRALAWCIAAKIAMPVTKSTKVLEKAEKNFQMYADIAKARTFNEGSVDTDQLAGYQAVR